MKLSTVFPNKKPVLSFEIFPPRHGGNLGSVYKTLGYLRALGPDFISVTFGAGGGSGDGSTHNVANIIRRDFGIEPLVHLTCQGASREDIDRLLDQLEQDGLINVLALRGDCPAESNGKDEGDFCFASQLIAHIGRRKGFHIAAACYPEGHPESKNSVQDLLHLKQKVEAGADHLISQLFFDNRIFYDFLEKAEIAGIAVPIEAGIMPVVNKNQIERMVSLCGASLPPKFRRILDKYEHHPEALCDAGIAYAVDQIVDLMASGVDGIHLYTMNNPQIAKRICQNVSSLFEVRPKEAG